MPYYEYLCDEGHKFDTHQRITEDALTKCEHRTTISCEETYTGAQVKQRKCTAPCRRLISKSSFTFKGGPPTPKYHQ